MVDYTYQPVAVAFTNHDSLFGVALKKYMKRRKYKYGETHNVKYGMLALNKRVSCLSRKLRPNASKFIEWMALLNVDMSFEFSRNGETYIVSNTQNHSCVRNTLKKIVDDIPLNEMYHVDSDFSVYDRIKFKRSLNLRPREVPNERIHAICDAFNITWTIKMKCDVVDVLLTSEEYYSQYIYDKK